MTRAELTALMAVIIEVGDMIVGPSDTTIDHESAVAWAREILEVAETTDGAA